MIKLPSGIKIKVLINDLRILSWEVSDTLIYYSKIFIGKSGLGLCDTMDELNKIKEKKIDKINKIGNSILVRIN